MGKSVLGNKLFASRFSRRAQNNLGIIDTTTGQKKFPYRSQALDLVDSYYERRQYDFLMPWDDACAADGDYVAIRKRKPRLNYPFAKNFAQRVTAKIVGESVFPRFLVQDDPNTQEFIAAVIREGNLRYHLAEPLRRTIACGSHFVYFYIIDGKFRIDTYKTKYCYPTWNENGSLAAVKVKYVYLDPADLDNKGDPKKKWFQLEINETAEISYDNPDYKEDQNPDDVIFQEDGTIQHNFGFVPGEWFRTDEESDDGCGFLTDIMDFIDEFNYSLSQSSQAVSYNQDPQTVINGMDEEELSVLIRSAAKSWNMGREGKAQFLESNLTGVERAIQLRDGVKLDLSDITRITVLDPEKIVGNAQSAKAMEILHGPLKDLVDELRTVLGPQIKDLVLKMAWATMMAQDLGVVPPIIIPPEYQPTSFDIDLKWPPLFQQTLDDLQKKVQIAGQAKTQGLIAPVTATKFVAEDFGVEDVEAEQAAVDAHAQAVAAMNPFGGGGF